jgi:rubrerythrin
MHELEGSRTYDHLLAVLAKEAIAARRFDFFARVAQLEGLAEAAELFSQARDSEVGFADGHMDFLRQVNDPESRLPIGATTRNLLAALSSEREDAEKVYPELARTAAAEGFPEISTWFHVMAISKAKRVEALEQARDKLDQFSPPPTRVK